MTRDTGEEKTSTPRMLCKSIPHTSIPAKLDPVSQVLVLSFDLCPSVKGCYKRNKINKG